MIVIMKNFENQQPPIQEIDQNGLHNICRTTGLDHEVVKTEVVFQQSQRIWFRSFTAENVRRYVASYSRNVTFYTSSYTSSRFIPTPIRFE